MTGLVGHPGLRRAYATLCDGAEFVMAYALDECDDGGPPSFYRTRLHGNQLRELDRFLSILTEEIALFLGDPGHDGAAFARQHNTANKLSRVRAMMALGSVDHERLSAIGRIRACLHHCAGQIHEPGLFRDLLIAHGKGSDIAPFAPGERLRLAPITRVRIGRFYGDIGRMLVDEAFAHRPDVDFSASCGHIVGANVACDGI